MNERRASILLRKTVSTLSARSLDTERGGLATSGLTGGPLGASRFREEFRSGQLEVALKATTGGGSRMRIFAHWDRWWHLAGPAETPARRATRGAEELSRGMRECC